MRKTQITILILFQFLYSFSQIRNQQINVSSHEISEWVGRNIDSLVKVHSSDSLGRKYLKHFENIINKTQIGSNLSEQYIDIKIDTSNYILNQFDDTLYRHFIYSKDKITESTWVLSKDNKTFYYKDKVSKIDTFDLKESYTFYINEKKFLIFKCSNWKRNFKIDNDIVVFLSRDFGVILIYSASKQNYTRISFTNQSDNFYINNLIAYILTKSND